MIYFPVQRVFNYLMLTVPIIFSGVLERLLLSRCPTVFRFTPLEY